MSDITDELHSQEELDQTQEAEKAPEQPAPKAAPAEPEQKPEPKPEKAEEMVPASVLARVRAEERAKAEYWEGIARQSQQPKAQEQSKYDFIADPDALPRYVQEQISRETAKVRADMSFAWATDRHGQDTVNAAIEAAKGNQAVIAAANASPDPYGHLVKWHKQQQFMAEVGADPEAYKRKLRAQWEAEMSAHQAVDQAKGRPAPASLAGEANLGARNEQGPQDVDLTSIIGRGG